MVEQDAAQVPVLDNMAERAGVQFLAQEIESGGGEAIGDADLLDRAGQWRQFRPEADLDQQLSPLPGDRGRAPVESRGDVEGEGLPLNQRQPLARVCQWPGQRGGGGQPGQPAASDGDFIGANRGW